MAEFGLVVIGAHIGIHIKEELEEYKNMKALLVEPVEHNVKSIKKNLKNFKNLIIEEIALADKTEIRDFFFIKEKSIHKLKKHWASGIGSFDKKHILSHRNKRFKVEEENIQKKEIQCLTFKDLIEKYEITSIEKLNIDIEGSEYEILNEIDYDKINIKKIMFEYKHFDGYFKTGVKFEEILSKLKCKNYTTTKIDEENILAIKF